MDAESGIFTAPAGGTYLFIFHIATHDNKKALLSIRKNGEEIASIFDQNHKDNHKNSMAGQTIIIDAQRGDEVSQVVNCLKEGCLYLHLQCGLKAPLVINLGRVEFPRLLRPYP